MVLYSPSSVHESPLTPLPTRGEGRGVQPSHTQLVFLISFSHCLWGPLSVTTYVSPSPPLFTTLSEPGLLGVRGKLVGCLLVLLCQACVSALPSILPASPSDLPGLFCLLVAHLALVSPHPHQPSRPLRHLLYQFFFYPRSGGQVHQVLYPLVTP